MILDRVILSNPGDDDGLLELKIPDYGILIPIPRRVYSEEDLPPSGGSVSVRAVPSEVETGLYLTREVNTWFLSNCPGGICLWIDRKYQVAIPQEWQSISYLKLRKVD